MNGKKISALPQFLLHCYQDPRFRFSTNMSQTIDIFNLVLSAIHFEVKLLKPLDL